MEVCRVRKLQQTINARKTSSNKGTSPSKITHNKQESAGKKGVITL